VPVVRKSRWYLTAAFLLVTLIIVCRLRSALRSIADRHERGTYRFSAQNVILSREASPSRLGCSRAAAYLTLSLLNIVRVLPAGELLGPRCTVGTICDHGLPCTYGANAMNQNSHSSASGDLFEGQGIQESWHCAMHGTVTGCPFRFMRCDVVPSPQDSASLSGKGWLAQILKTKPTIER
jgi:hypothetical protein